LESETLTLSGKILGKLEAVTEHLGFETDSASITSEAPFETVNRLLTVRQTKMKHCFEMASWSEPYPSGGTYFSACKQTFVAGITPSRERAAAEVDENFEEYNRMILTY
jgi:hypothetical protein